MDAFEFVFSFFGLLLGFTLVEVLSGLVRAVKRRRKVRLGWLTPLLGIFVMLHLTSFWIDAWHLRQLIPATDAALLIGLIFTGTYYFAASLVFPEGPEEWADLDHYYFENKRPVLTLVLLSDILNSALSHLLRREPYDEASFFAVGIAALLILVGVVIKTKRSNLILLCLLIAMALMAALTDVEKSQSPSRTVPAAPSLER